MPGYASVPPSTGIAMPVTNDALSDKRNTATSPDLLGTGRAAHRIAGDRSLDQLLGIGRRSGDERDLALHVHALIPNCAGRC
ncbi:hypothetical protein MTX20_05020 [Bradyrhizobium sp. ISRA435]|nr:hypothetical protein MTX20_05020 [Bradyrhizobium sp. ISRA435]